MTEVKIVPTRDFDALNALVQHPEVFPHIVDDSITDKLDVSLFNQRDNMFLLAMFDGKPGGFLAYIYRGFGVYELHSGFLPQFRGIKAIRAGKKAIDWMFLNTSAEILSTWAWENAENVIFAAHKAGFKDQTTLEWHNTVRGQRVDRRILSLTIMEWAREEQNKYKTIGDRVVATLPDKMRGYMGITMIMGLNGLPLKAQEFWNRHAVMLGGSPIQVFAPRGGSMVFSMNKEVHEMTRELNFSTIEHLK